MKSYVAGPSLLQAPVVVNPRTPSQLPFEKHEWEHAGIDFVFATRRGCSGRNISPEEFSDLLVSLLTG